MVLFSMPIHEFETGSFFMKEGKVVVVLANGFEEIEAITPIDVLRRAGLDVVVAGVGSLDITGAHGMVIRCDCEVSSVLACDVRAIVLPGGMPGALNLHESDAVCALIVSTSKADALVCAICASPAVVLAPLGVLAGKKAVCYPGMETGDRDIGFEKSSSCVRDGNVVTAAGPGCAFDFAFEIARALCGDDVVNGLKESMVWGR